jgi:hypothetical protein
MIDWIRRNLAKSKRAAANDTVPLPEGGALARPDVSDRNEHVKNYLRYYLSFSTPPLFAVLLNGPWGIGKTFVIKNFVKLLGETTRHIYVSLYGLRSVDDIDDAILRSMYPVLKHKGVEIGGRALKSVGKYFHVELDLTARDFIARSKSDLYIFDDLERCEMPLNTVMGYINVFVEQEGRKVIIIANEAEIRDEAYQRIREKLVGKAFEIQSAFEEALEAFIASIKNREAKKLVASKSSVIAEIYHQSELNNLRVLQQTIWDFERLYVLLDEKHRSNDDAMTALLGLLFVLSFEVKAGRLSAEGIKERQANLLTAFMRRDEDGEATQIVEVGKRYPTIRLDTDLLSDQTLVNVIVKGNVDQTRICSELDESSFFVTVEHEPAWRTVWHAHERTEDEVNRALAEMERTYAAREYTVAGEVLHVFGLRLWLSKIGAIAESHEQVLVDGRAYVDDLYGRGLLEPIDPHGDYFDMAFNAYGGLGIHEAESVEYRQLRDYLNEKRRATEVDRRPAIAVDLLANMRDDPSLFLRRVCLTNHEDNKFYDIPVLASLDPAKFVAVFLGLHPHGQRNAMIALETRYEHGRIDKDLLDERPWAIEVRNQIQAASEAMPPIPKDRLRRLLAHALDGVLGVVRQDSVEGGD